VRFVLAFTVFLVHSYVLSQHPGLGWLGLWLSSNVAVKGFFVVSGYLVFMSYENASSVRDYLEKRARRIYPAYFAVVCVFAIGGVFMTSKPLSEYLSPEFARYLIANLAFLNFLAPTLPGVFDDNPVHAVNGVLWTLKIEVMFYVCVPVIAAVATKWHRLATLTIFYTLSVAYSLIMLGLLKSTGQPLYEMLARQLPGQMTYFMVGAAYYYYRDRLTRYRHWLLASAAAVFLFQGEMTALVLEPLALGTIVVYCATHLKYLGNFGRFGDFSYGVYLIHFPILQSFVWLGLIQQNAVLGLLTATVVVLSAAFLSWHLVEKRWLKKSSHYVVVNK
jgi:peptidoglycan/LPS O-acetylase OafA/YrhL